MGHTALPMLMATLSCYAWINVEVRRTHDASHLKGWRIALSTPSLAAKRWATIMWFNVFKSTLHDVDRLADAHLYVRQV